jgi:hypothetical protein
MKRIAVDTNSNFFHNVFVKVVRQVKYPKTDVTVSVVDSDRSAKIRQEVKDSYKFVFDYPEENETIVGVEVYRL